MRRPRFGSLAPGSVTREPDSADSGLPAVGVVSALARPTRVPAVVLRLLPQGEVARTDRAAAAAVGIVITAAAEAAAARLVALVVLR